MIRAGIVGPTGYSGLDLINILLRHPEAEIVYLGGRREERPHIADIWPSLAHRLDMRCALTGVDPLPEMDVVFLALPHTVAMDYAPQFLAKGVRVVDISADYRLKTAELYKQYYGKPHSDAGNLVRAVYGLCEFFRDEIVDADLVANPGCYPTAVQIALGPAVKHGLTPANAKLIVDAKSGVTGAGKSPKPNLHYPEMNESFTAYKVGVHQHRGEMIQTLNRLGGREVDLLFVPHLVPMDRGILATCYIPLVRPYGEGELRAVYEDFYKNDPFVRIRKDGAVPNTKHVSYSNFVDVSIHELGDTAVRHQRHRQPGEGRFGPGRSEYEHYVRRRGNLRTDLGKRHEERHGRRHRRQGISMRRGALRHQAQGRRDGLGRHPERHARRRRGRLHDQPGAVGHHRSQ